MNRRTLISWVAVLGMLLGHGRALFAHDFWIEPSAFRPHSTPVGLRFRVGDGFPGERFPRNPTHVRRFVALGPAGIASVQGRPGIDPAGYLAGERPGLYVIGYRSTRSEVTLPAEKFERYLAEEEFAWVKRHRAEHGRSQVPGRELFSRCAKSLVAVGDPRFASDGTDTALGLTLELIAETNPYGPYGPSGRRRDAEFPVRLLYQGSPLAGARVVARNRDDPTRMLTARTNTGGRVAFPLAEAGMWLIRAIHMVPAPAGSDADWESFWASLTFELPEES